MNSSNAFRLGILLSILPTFIFGQTQPKTPKYILRNKDFVERRTTDNAKSFAQSYFEGYQEALAMQNVANKRANTWTPAGPAGKTRLAGTGRINSITFHPKFASTMFICVAQGGIWKSTNSGQSWISVSGDLPILRTSSLAIHPTKPDTMYVAVGDFAYLGHNLKANENKRNTHYGLGIYKTVNGGDSWTATGLSFKQSDFEGSLLSNVLINPKDPEMVMAAGETGCYLSTDGGANWNKTASGIFWDVKVSPNDPSILFASTGYVTSYEKGQAGLHRSTDFGKTWTKASVPFNTTKEVQRLELATCKSNPARVYALAADAESKDISGSGFYAIYVSNDTGKTYTTVIQEANYPYNLLGWNFDDEPGGQGRYDLAFFADDKDDEKLYVGGVNMWSSANGGKDFLPVSFWQLNYQQESIHADIHEIKQHPASGRIYVCHDGGLSSTQNVISVPIPAIENDITETDWSHHIDNLSTLSFYRLGLNPEDGEQIVAGAQDNSTAFKADTSWVNLTGGDGMECLFDPNGMIYTSSQYGRIFMLRKWQDNEYIFSGSLSGAPNGEVAEWTSPMVLANDQLYIGYGNVYIYDFDLSNPLTSFADAKNKNFPLPSTALYVEPEQAKHMYLAKRGYASEGIDGEVWASANGGDSWTDISNGLPMKLYPSYMDAQDAGPDTAWITFANFEANEKIYETRDGGKTWTNISYNLPNLPVNCVAHQNDANNNLYVGTDLGIYLLNRDDKKWEPYMEGLPNVIVSELEVHLGDFKLKAATFGRGIWEADLAGTPNIIGVNEILSNQLELKVSVNDQAENLTINLKGDNRTALNLVIIDVTGKVLLQDKLSAIEFRKEISTQNWLSGTYYVAVSDGKTRVVEPVVLAPEW